MISTSSPFFSSVRSGMWRPLIFAPTQSIADIGMNGIGEIDGVGAARQRDQPALRREAEHLVEEQLKLRMLQKLLGVIAFKEIVDELAKPLIGGAFARAPALARRARRRSAWRAPRACSRSAPQRHIRRSDAFPPCAPAARRAGGSGRRWWCGSTGTRYASASRCSP